MPEINFCFSEKQTAFDQAVERYPVVLFGGARGGGKSFALRNIMLKRRLIYPGTHGAIFRRTYEELESNHIRQLLSEHPFLKKCYKKQERLIELPNGSTLEFCHCRYYDELDMYQGREWEDLAVDEAGQWPEDWIHRLRGSNRTSKPGLAPRMLLTGNPGGIGHQFLKRAFISRTYNSRENPDDYGFVQSFVQDNPALMEHDPGYIARLQAEPNEMLRRAFLYGDWDLQAGQFYGECNRDNHLVKPFPIPSHWRRFGAFDPGYNHPAGFGWFACDEDGVVYLYRFYLERSRRIDQIAKDIGQYPDTFQLYQIVGGHDCWARGRDGGPTIADQLSTYGIHLSKANIDRVQGATELRQRLAWQGLPSTVKGPRLKFFDNADCKRAFETVANMTHDPRHPEDVMKVDANGEDKWAGDEAYDVIRYGMMGWPLSSKRQVSDAIPTVEECRQAKALRWHLKQRKKRKDGRTQYDSVLGRYVQ
jgi:phage terminase large subunit